MFPNLTATAKDILMPHQQATTVKTYLFACVHNAGRSQMAAALFNIYANRDGCVGISAGTQPASQVHPEVVQIMREIGVDLTGVKPQKLTDELASSASVPMFRDWSESIGRYMTQRDSLLNECARFVMKFTKRLRGL